MEKELQIVYIEDNPDDANLTLMTLRRSGLKFNIKIVETEMEFISAITSFAPDLILSDHSLPGFDSMSAFKIMNTLLPGTPFILLTGSVTEQFVVDSLLKGIDDYILKSNLIRLPSSIERVLAKKQLSHEKEVIQNLHSQLKEAYGEIESKNREITDSINYAKRIQDAILPHDDQINEEFSNGFVIYQPRDIVSGDLYWLTQTTTTDGRGLSLKIVAAADCTGHGVPGAFMSLLVSELLNQTIKNPEINSPADVLSHLNNRLPASLNRNQRERITDGLDMAVCALDPLRHTVYFAGANRPLWIVRNTYQNSELIEIKGTKACIGSHTPSDQLFENHSIPVQSGDRLFLFTDGVTDQFGGPNCKKMGKQTLREMLLSSSGMPMQEQKKYLEKFIADWKANLDQVDDILFIGIGIA